MQSNNQKYSSVESSTMVGTTNNLQEIVCQIDPPHHLQLPRIDEKDIDAETPTPARPAPVVPNDERNPQDKAQAKEDKNESSKFKKIAIITSISLTCVLVGACIAIIVMATRPRFQTIVIREYVSVPMASQRQNVRTTALQVKDPEIFKSQAPIDVYATKIQQKQTKTNPQRLLQQSNTLTTYTIYDKVLNCGVTISSLGFQMTLVIDVSKLLTFIFNSQPPVQVKEQTLTKNQKEKENTQIKTVTYNYPMVGQKILRIVKDRLKKQGEIILATQTTSIFMKYNKQINAFEIVPRPEASENQTAILFEASKVKLIKDFNNEDELTEAASQIVYGVIMKVKQFFEKRYPELKTKTGIELNAIVRDFGFTSIQLKKASDYQKECSSTCNSTLKCDTKMLSSDAVNIQVVGDKIQPPTSDLKMHFDLF